MIEREIERFVLRGHPRMSGRAVRLRALLPTEVDAVAKDAGTLASANAIDFRNMQLRLGVARCLMGITRARVPLVNVPVLGKDGKPRTQPAVDDDGQPKVGADGKQEREPIVTEEPDQTWLADEKNWLVPDRQLIEMPGGYDGVISNPKDDAWLCGWYSQAHEVSGQLVSAIMEKGQRVSSG